MSSFSESALEKKLSELSNSQQSVQTLSLWLIHHRKHAGTIVHVWHRELRKAKPSRKLTFIYLANDVIQNSKRKGPEFTKAFEGVLVDAFSHVSRESEQSCKKQMERVLNIWHERSVYDGDFIQQLKLTVDESNSPSLEDNAGSKVLFDQQSSCPSSREKHGQSKKGRNSEVMKGHESAASDSSSSTSSETRFIGEENRGAKRSYPVEEDEDDDYRVNYSPIDTGTGPLLTENLIKALQDLENAASGDATVRQKIASLPQEVQDVSLLENIADKAAAERLSKIVDEACLLLAEYNGRLAAELDDRRQLARMLTEYISSQKEILGEKEKKLTEYKQKLAQVTQVRKELKSHIQNLPDLSLLPNVTGGLAPLPSAGDLFSSD
ncbi:regulation of nuclear pre-mRNA domain-containing protein 1B [Callorhinchus milii]|uniref:Regulation of nuclear pre-mRNA domain-containing 1A n=2 Tax=Callorhinchus milii TaxID=7868 RepID=V9KTY3_CALMI|nr:regulation of nuclear pre-mRNA domain-containing protein 1B [Callorhinchus milii]|eukprot:gi/632939505/ref/XP_007910314.1/ PREDICTED: regulation of nuclear pre-mRNA domain-containing protein 1B [Callorhinchus milii]